MTIGGVEAPAYPGSRRVSPPWRLLDTMQFTTDLVARLPRCRCPEHGVETIVPAAGSSRIGSAEGL